MTLCVYIISTSNFETIKLLLSFSLKVFPVVLAFCFRSDLGKFVVYTFNFSVCLREKPLLHDVYIHNCIIIANHTEHASYTLYGEITLVTFSLQLHIFAAQRALYWLYACQEQGIPKFKLTVSLNLHMKQTNLKTYIAIY